MSKRAVCFLKYFCIDYFALDESKANHKYSIVQQQKVYKAEIERIFNNQKRALGKYMNENDRNREMEKMKSKKLVIWFHME